MAELREKAPASWICLANGGPACWDFTGPGPGSCRGCKFDPVIVAEAKRAEARVVPSKDSPERRKGIRA